MFLNRFLRCQCHCHETKPLGIFVIGYDEDNCDRFELYRNYSSLHWGDMPSALSTVRRSQQNFHCKSTDHAKPYSRNIFMHCYMLWTDAIHLQRLAGCAFSLSSSYFRLDSLPPFRRHKFRAHYIWLGAYTSYGGDHDGGWTFQVNRAGNPTVWFLKQADFVSFIKHSLIIIISFSFSAFFSIVDVARSLRERFLLYQFIIINTTHRSQYRQDLLLCNIDKVVFVKLLRPFRYSD